MPWARGGSAAPAAAMVMIALPVLGLLLWMSYKTIAGKINPPPPSPIVAQKVEGNIQRPLLDVPPSAALPPGSCRCSISCPVCLACLHAVGEGRLRRTRRGYGDDRVAGAGPAAVDELQNHRRKNQPASAVSDRCAKS